MTSIAEAELAVKKAEDALRAAKDAHLAFRKYERDERRIDRKAGKL